MAKMRNGTFNPATHQSRRSMALAVAMLLGPIFAVLTSCSRTVTQRIALITPLTTSDLWKGMHAGAYRAVQERGITLYWNGPTDETDASQQATLIERQLRRGVYGIVLAPNHASVLISAVAEAERQKVPVVLAGGALAVPMGAGVGTVASDDEEAGRVAAAFITSKAASGDVAILGVDPGNSAALMRVRSFEHELLRHSGFHLVEKTLSEADPLSVDDVSPQLFARHPRLVAVFAPTVGAARSARDTIRDSNGRKRVLLVSCDQDAELLDDLHHGGIDAVVAQNVYQVGYRATLQLIQHVHDGLPLHTETVSPLLLTLANVDAPQTRQFLRPYAGFDR